MTANRGLFNKSHLPAHFSEDNPRFVEFLSSYYQWLHRNGGMTSEELESLRENTDGWLGKNVDRFISTGSSRWGGSRFAKVDAELEIMRYKPPGFIDQHFVDMYNMDRVFDEFVTSDGEAFGDSSDLRIEAPFELPGVKESWAGKFNHELVKTPMESSGVDDNLHIRMLKNIYAAKGTKKCIEIFFSVYFGDDVEVKYPKFDICTLDDNFDLDSKNSIRDDDFYQEYSYVIYVPKEVGLYEDVFKRVYMKNFHPGGFKVFLKKREQ